MFQDNNNYDRILASTIKYTKFIRCDAPKNLSSRPKSIKIVEFF